MGYVDAKGTRAGERFDWLLIYVVAEEMQDGEIMERVLGCAWDQGDGANVVK